MNARPEQPELPKICDFLEAVRYSSEWTGIAQKVVEQVLSAKERYLSLAGIAECEVEESLLREREVFRHLLPETPTFIDDRATEYIALTTGFDEETIRRIEQGESAYMDSLGLIVWGNYAERDSGLGSPELPEDQASEDGDEEPMFEGHGDHWECLVPEVGPFIQKFMAEPLVYDHLRFSVPSPYSRWNAVTVRATPQTQELETWRMDGYADGGEEIISAFPVARDGCTHTLSLHRARVWKADCEAIVLASTSFGASIAYFDTAYLHPWNEWEPDQEAEVQLAAFAYRLEPAPDQIIEITKEDTIRVLRASQNGQTPEEVTDLSPIEVHSGGMACFFPDPIGNPDDFEFQGPVVQVDVMHAWGQTLYRLEVTVMRDTRSDTDIPFTIPVYAAEANLPVGYRPRVGDQVRGLLWLQGCPTGLAYPILGSAE